MSHLRHFSAQRWMLASVLLGGLSPLTAVAQQTETPPIVQDVLEKPALEIKDIARTMMIGVARQGSRLAVVGERGGILTSDDGGKTWVQAGTVPVSVTLTSIVFADDNNVWAAGHSGVLLHSDDGGQTWNKVFDGADIAKLIFDTASERQAKGVEGADREVRSAQYLVDEGPDKPLLTLHFDNPTTGWALGAYGIALETRDGGKSWQSVGHKIPNIFGSHLYEMERVGDYLLISGEQGAVFMSADDGATFQKVEADYDGTFFGLAEETAQTAIFYGLRGNVWRLAIADAVLPDDQPSDAGSPSDEEPAPSYEFLWEQVDNGPEVTVAAGGSIGNGKVLLADQGGRLTIAEFGSDAAERASKSAGGAVNDLVLAADGAVIVAGPRGPVRIDNFLQNSGAE